MMIQKIFLTALLLMSQAALGEALPAKPQSELNRSDGVKETPKSTSEASPGNSVGSVTLGAVTADVEGDLTIVTARLNGSPLWKNVEIEEHGTFLQIKLPRTIIPASGDFLDGNGPFLRKLASFQLSGDDGALRLFINQDASKAKLATSAELLGDRIVITIDHKKLEQLISPATKGAISDAVPSVNEAINSPVAIATPKAVESAGAPASTNPASAENRQLHAQLTKGAAICAVLFMALLGLQFLKARRGRLKNQAKNTPSIEPVAMRVLSTISLGQKQKLTLVQVGTQQILLGLTPDSISLLTNIEDKSHEKFARALESANPNAEVRLKNPAELTPGHARKTLTTPAVKSRPVSNTRGSSINIAIGEDGPMDMKPSKSEDDITKILRDRLRNLPPG